MTQTNEADLAAQRAAKNMNFLANSYAAKKKMNAQNGNTFAAGSQLSFTAPILPGWARKMRIFYDLNVALTSAGGAGTATLNAGAPYNILSNVAVDFSGQNHRNHSGYLLKLLQQTYRGLLDLDASKAYANAIISSSLPVAAGAAGVEVDNKWKGYMDVPLQIEANDVGGLVPIGESATPLTLRLTCAPQFAGTDPLSNCISLVGDTVAVVTGTITAVVDYRYGQSVHSPAIRPETPYIGTFAKIIDQVTAINNTSDYTTTELRQPYPHLKVMQLVVVPSLGSQFCDPAEIGGTRFDLDPSTVMLDYSPAGAGYNGLLVDQRELYHGDLDPGVIVYDFIAGSMPEVPNGMNTPNIGNYNAAQTEVLYSGALAGVNDRLITASMFLEPLPY